MKAIAARFWHEWIRPGLFCAAIIFPFRSAIADWNYVPSGSMNPTILAGDLVFVNRLAYDLKLPFTTLHLAEWGGPARGDIIVFYSPVDGTRLVKRVVGLPGDLVELRNEILYVNGRPARYGSLPAAVSGELPAAEKASALFARESVDGRSHAVMVLPGRPALRTFAPVRVPAGSYFAMGDNRDNSQDSRFIGCVPRAQILGSAKAVIVSGDLDRYGRPRFDRFFTRLD